MACKSICPSLDPCVGLKFCTLFCRESICHMFDMHAAYRIPTPLYKYQHTYLQMYGICACDSGSFRHMQCVMGMHMTPASKHPDSLPFEYPTNTSKSMVQEKSCVSPELTKVPTKTCDHLISGQDLFLGCGLRQVEGNLHLLTSVFHENKHGESRNQDTLSGTPFWLQVYPSFRQLGCWFELWICCMKGRLKNPSGLLLLSLFGILVLCVPFAFSCTLAAEH